MTRRIDRWIWLVIGAAALRYAFAAVLGATQLVEHNGWYWSNDKDEVEYYATAHALVHGAIAPIYTFMGYGTLLAPLVGGTTFVLQAIPRVAIVQLVLTVPAAVLLFRAGERLFDRRAAAIGTALWLTLPIWLSAIWFRSYSPPFNMASYWLGLEIGVDFGTALLAIATLALTSGARTDGGLARGIAIGIASGLTLLAKPSNVVLVGSAVLALCVWRRWRSAAAALLAAGVVTVPQLVLDWRISGRPLHIQYWSAWPYGNSKALQSIAYVPRSLGKLLLLNYTGPLLFLACTAALIVTWRRYPAARWLVVAQVVGYVLFFAPLYYSISEFMLRFLTTALPALCLACGAALVRPLPAEAGAKPLGRVALGLGVLGIAAGVGLAIFVGLAPFRPVVPVVAGLKPTAAAGLRPGWVSISWKAPPSSAKLAYRVNRSRSPAGKETSLWVGVKTAIRDRPGRGTWYYRVYIEPSSHPGGLPQGTRDFGVSPPGRAVVR